MFGSISNADNLSGIATQEVTIDGKSYEIPIGNENRKNDIYYLKKAINGDKEALDIFLEGQEVRWFFIGQEKPLWLVANKDGRFKVTEPVDFGAQHG